MGHRPLPSEPALIEHQEQIEALCVQCRQEGRFAFDTEFVMEDRYESDVCLVQVGTRHCVAIIDPLMDLDLSPVWNLINDDGVQTVVHAGQEDFALAVQHSGNVPRNVFDVQIAAGLVGYDYPMSLQRLAQVTLHIRLHKSKTLTDWRRRPLTPDLIRYGAEDVAHLLEVCDIMERRLAGLSRAEWAWEEFQRLEDMTFYRRVEEDKIARVKGAGALSARQLAIVRELIIWRETFAQRVNRPVRVVFKDHLLVEIARHAMAEFSEIRSLRGLNLPDRDVRALCRVVQRAAVIPSDQWPTPKPRQHETPQEGSLVALLTAVIRSYCMEHDLAYELVATRKSIRELIRFRRNGDGSRDRIALLSGWRGRSVGKLLDDVLSGRRTVCVERVDGAPTVHVRPAEDDP